MRRISPSETTTNAGGSPEEGGAAITFAVLALCRYVEELTEQVTRIADNLCGEE